MTTATISLSVRDSLGAITAGSITATATAASSITNTSGGSLIDSSGAVWMLTISAPGVETIILRNGVNVGNWGLLLVLDTAGAIWSQNAELEWWKFSGPGWSLLPGPPPGYGTAPAPTPPPPTGTALLDTTFAGGWTSINTGSSRLADNGTSWLAWGYTTLQRYVNFTQSGEYTFTIPAYAWGTAPPTPPQSGLLLLVDGIPVGTVGQPTGYEWANCVNNLAPAKSYVWKGSFLAGTHSVVIALNAVTARNNAYPSGYLQQIERLTIAATGNAYPAEPAGSRDPSVQPYSSLHFMNQPLKDGATWSISTDGDQQALASMNVVAINNNFWTNGLWVGQATDPVWTWRAYGSDAHVVGDNSKGYSVRAPQSMTPSPGDSGLFITDGTNKRYHYSMFNAVTDATAHTATANGPGANNSTGIIIDSYNATEHAYHQQIGATAGMIRQSDLNSGAINHKLVFGMAGNMMTQPQSNWTGFGWPAAESDAGAPTGQYSGVPGIQYGALIGIPLSVTMPSTLSPGGKVLWKQLQTYGGIVGVQAGAPNRETAIYAEMGASGSLLNDMFNDWPIILTQYCRICRNNTRATPNGIGNPLAPMLPGLIQGLPAVTH